MRYKWLTAPLILLALLPATVSGTVIPVTAGENAIDAALFTAAAGDTLELTTDGGVYNEAFTTVIDIPVTIRAADGLAAKPVWTSNASSNQIMLAADLTLDGIIFNGSANDSLTENCIRIDPPNSEGIDLRVNDCVIMNFNDGVVGDEDGHGIKGSEGTKMDSVVITNSKFMHMPGEHISFKDEDPTIAPGSVKYLRVEYCTFWDGNNEAIYIQAHDAISAGTPDPEVIFNHLTVVDMGSKALYPNTIDGAIIKNCLVAYNSTDEYSNRLYGTNSVLTNHLFYECPKGISLQDGATYDGRLTLEEQNPYFADYENGDFAVAANSPAALFADDGGALGDTSWGTWDASAVTNWEIAANGDWGRLVKNATTDGDTIMFVTSGGDYYTPTSIATKEQTLTFMAKPGLAAKPVLTVDYYQSRLLQIHGSSTVKGLRFEGSGMLTHPDSTAGEVTPYLLYWEDEYQHYAKVVVEDCEFARNRLRAIHTDDMNTMDTLIVRNCFFEEIGEYAIYRSWATRSVEVAIITGNTFYKLGGGGVRLNNVGELVVTNNTFFFGDSSLTNRSVIGVRAQNDTVTTIRDNIFASFDYKGVEVYGPDPTVEYNLFMDCGINVINDDDTTMTFTTFNIEGDPIFKDTSAATLDLAVEVNGDAIGNASDGGNLGDPRWGTWTLSSVDDRGGELPIAYALHQNYPNPFNPSTTIRFDVAAAGHASLKVYDLLGREIVTLVDQVMEPGYHTITWNAEGLTSGIYFYRIQVNDFVKNRKLVILK